MEDPPVPVAVQFWMDWWLPLNVSLRRFGVAGVVRGGGLPVSCLFLVLPGRSAHKQREREREKRISQGRERD